MNENFDKIENNESDFISLKDIYAYLYKYKYLIILITALVVTLAYFYTKKQPLIYKATASIIINGELDDLLLSPEDIIYVSESWL